MTEMLVQARTRAVDLQPNISNTTLVYSLPAYSYYTMDISSIITYVCVDSRYSIAQFKCSLDMGIGVFMYYTSIFCRP